MQGGRASSGRLRVERTFDLLSGGTSGVTLRWLGDARWDRMNLNLPRVPVHDIKIKHEDVCIATHGRGFFHQKPDEVGQIDLFSYENLEVVATRRGD